MGEWKCNQEVIMCSIKVVQTSFCTKPKPSFKAKSCAHFPRGYRAIETKRRTDRSVDGSADTVFRP